MHINKEFCMKHFATCEDNSNNNFNFIYYIRVYRINSKHSTMVVHWTAGQQVQQLILHLGHGSK